SPPRTGTRSAPPDGSRCCAAYSAPAAERERSHRATPRDQGGRAWTEREACGKVGRCIRGCKTGFTTREQEVYLVTNVTRARRQARLSRARGLPLTPKSVKYFEKRPSPPGEHGRARRRTESDYAVRLKEKQRLRAQYGLREKQLHRAYLDAKKEPGLTG